MRNGVVPATTQEISQINLSNQNIPLVKKASKICVEPADEEKEVLQD